ncbi:MAG: hypothetical protein H6721_34115 [Sandaracinus sp.]|nr:hypothetical protein [Sandaracinus sp.]
MRTRFWVGALGAFWLSACASGAPASETCETAADCRTDETCLDQRCVPRSESRRDAGGDATTIPMGDASTLPDGGTDAGPICMACDDGDACTTDSCVSGPCVYTPVSCDDGNACTVDACDSATGCTTTPVDCDDGDACTADACDAAAGCMHDRMTASGDLCAGAVDVSAGGTFTGSLACATHATGGVCGAADGADVQHVLMLTAPRRVRATLTGEGSPVLSFGRTCGAGDLACGNADLLLDAGTYFLSVDAGSGVAGAYSLVVELLPYPSPETVAFPTAADTRVAASNLYYWRAGDYVQGPRSTSLPRARRAVVSLGFPSNGLTCDSLPMRMRINGTEVGTFTITPGMTRATPTFDFAAIAGPTFTLRYETMRVVASGCGAVTFDEGTSTVQLSP